MYPVPVVDRDPCGLVVDPHLVVFLENAEMLEIKVTIKIAARVGFVGTPLILSIGAKNAISSGRYVSPVGLQEYL